MSASPATRRAVAEIDFGDGANASFKVGNRSIHQFWHLFSSHFRHVLLAPQRRADSGKVAWTWREPGEKRPVTATELVEVRRRLSEANRSLAGGFGGMGRRDDDEEASLEGQVRVGVGEMVDQLLAQRDSTLTGFVCRTDAGLMLHSWGAAVAAQPYFPDAQHGEISGTVFVGVERPAGVSVVLENTQGIGGARVKSDKEGVFRFPNVAPGSYHLRVADRSDFPGRLTVEIERESISGLELRNTSDEPLSMAGSITPAVEDVPWFRRRRTGLIFLMLISGAGALAWWWSKRSSDAQAVAENQSSSWQSAKGKLATNNPQTPANDDHKVVDDGAFSHLSSSVPPSKLRITRASSAPKAGSELPADRTILQSGDSESSIRRVAGKKKSPAEIGNKSVGNGASDGDHPLPGSNEKMSDASTEKNGSSANPEAIPSNGDELKAVGNKPAKLPRSMPEKKLPAAQSATSSSSDDRPESDAPSSAADGAASDAAKPSMVRSGGKNTRKVAASKSSVPAGAPAASPTPDASPEGDDLDSAGGPAGVISPDQSKSNQGKKTNPSAKGAAGNKLSTAAGPSAVSTIECEVPNESTDAGPSAGKRTGPAVPAKEADAGENLPTQPNADEASALEGGEASASKAVAGATTTRATKQNAGDMRKPASAAKAETDETTSASEDSPETSAAAASSVSTKQKSPAQRPRSAKNGITAASFEVQEDEPAAEASIPVEAAATEKPIRPFAATVPPRNALRSIGTIRVSPWKSRLIQDLILPTRPTTADEEETVEAVRKKALQERIAQKPAGFQQPIARTGLAFEFGVDGAGKSASPHWENDRDAEASESSATGNRAELEWGVAGPTPNASYTLSYSDGRVIALVSVDKNGVPTLKTAAGVRAWYWLGVERKAADGSPARREGGAKFDWRLLPEGTIPPSWKTDDRWAGGQGQRVDIPLDSTTARVGDYEIALVDPASGWAIARSLSVQKP